MLVQSVVLEVNRCGIGILDIRCRTAKLLQDTAPDVVDEARPEFLG